MGGERCCSEEQDDVVVVERQSHQSFSPTLSPRRFVSSELPSPCICSGVEERAAYSPATIKLHPCPEGNEGAGAGLDSSCSPEGASTDDDSRCCGYRGGALDLFRFSDTPIFDALNLSRSQKG